MRESAQLFNCRYQSNRWRLILFIVTSMGLVVVIIVNCFKIRGLKRRTIFLIINETPSYLNDFYCL